MDINDLDYDNDDEFGIQSTPEDNYLNEDDNLIVDDDNHDESSVILDYLQTKGIDWNNIKFENEETKEIESRRWDDLTKEELLNILLPEESQSDLDDDELDLINRIRLSLMSIDDYLAYERLKGVSEYMKQQSPEPSYVVDDYDDDTLFKLDLLTKIGEDQITDEELEEALNNAKQNESLFKKQITGLREEYKRLEEEKNAREEAELTLAQQEQFIQYSNSVINSINNFTNLGELDVTMEDDDRNQLYTFLTGSDPAGVSYLSKALQDPDTLVRMAWFALNGEDVINSISDYYKLTITLISQNQYKKGFEDAKNGNSPSVVIKPTSKQNKSTKKITTINDLY